MCSCENSGGRGRKSFIFPLVYAWSSRASSTGKLMQLPVPIDGGIQDVRYYINCRSNLVTDGRQFAQAFLSCESAQDRDSRAN